MTEVAVRAACDRCDQPCWVEAGFLQALFLSSVRRIDAARQVMQRVSAAVAAREDPKLKAIATLVNAMIALTVGDFVDAAAQSENGLRLAGEAGLTGWTPLGNLVMATTALRRSEVSTMILYANRLKEDAVFGREMLPVGATAWTIVQITEAEKGPEQAASLARELLQSDSTIRSLLAADPAALPWLVRMMVNLDQHELARRAVDSGNRLAAENPDIQSIGPAVRHAAGILDADLDALRQAADEHIDAWARASTFEDIGVLLTVAHQDAQAAEHLELAMRSYGEMGSIRDLSRVRRRLRCLNVNGPSQVRFWPASRISGLTDTEYAVAKLVANGLTNGQAAKQMFLSRHTVAFHLRKIFQKTGVKSRLELAVIWNELDVHGSQNHAA